MNTPTTSTLTPFIPPQLAAFSKTAPQGTGWYYERKYDGYRMQIVISGGAIRFFTRSGIDVSQKLESLLPALEALRACDMTLDGELCDDSDGDQTSLVALNQSFHHGGPFRFFAFDMLKLGDEDLSAHPLWRRKTILSSVLSNLHGLSNIRLVPFQTCAGDALFDEMVDNRHEGIIAKRADAPYRPGQRTSDWLKVKVLQEESYAIVGWQTDPAKSIVKSLLVGSHHRGDWTYRGRVGTGWSSTERKALLKSLKAVECSAPVLSVPIRGEFHCADGTRKVLVRFADISHHGILRHPRFIAEA